MDLCLFCKKSAYKTDKEYICGSCVQVLFKAYQADLKRAYNKALEKGYRDKARAIESFLITEDEGEQRKPFIKKRGRHSNRKGIVRPVGNKKERPRRIKAKQEATVL